jgi:DNA replication ATP-dependent helicase Dna2
MDVSLFEWLDSEESSVELVHQYRMNDEIMKLANAMTYDSKLQCISDTIPNICVQMDQNYLLNSDHSHKMMQILSDSIVFIDTSEIIKKLTVSDGETNESGPLNNELKTQNRVEIEIVYKLCEIFSKQSDCKSPDDIGIIAPYNNQVKELQNKFSGRDFFKDVEINTVDQFQGLRHVSAFFFLIK